MGVPLILGSVHPVIKMTKKDLFIESWLNPSSLISLCL
uniref:Uncharacterized protein n=1 Tax=Anguilla anguilla TaxID=7936 RepID=A0A0E9SKW4_ANGAN